MIGAANSEIDQIGQLQRNYSHSRQRFNESRSHVNIARYIHESQKVLQLKAEKGMDLEYQKIIDKVMEDQQPEIQERLFSYLQGEPGLE